MISTDTVNYVNYASDAHCLTEGFIYWFFIPSGWGIALPANLTPASLNPAAALPSLVCWPSVSISLLPPVVDFVLVV